LPFVALTGQTKHFNRAKHLGFIIYESYRIFQEISRILIGCSDWIAGFRLRTHNWQMITLIAYIFLAIGRNHVESVLFIIIYIYLAVCAVACAICCAGDDAIVAYGTCRAQKAWQGWLKKWAEFLPDRLFICQRSNLRSDRFGPDILGLE
jgi:hypothetical protein